MMLENIMRLGKSMELAETQAEGIKCANRISKRVNESNRHGGRKNRLAKRDSGQEKKRCSYCSYRHIPGKNNCPAYGKKCRSCQKWNHFQSCCKANTTPTEKKKTRNSKANPLRRRDEVNNLGANDDMSSSGDEYVFANNTNTIGAVEHGKLPRFRIKLNGTLITIMADTGASVNLLDESSFAKLKEKPRLEVAKEKIFPYGTVKPLPIIGKCQCEVESEKKFSVETFYIVKGKHGCLVSWATSERYDLVQVVKSVETTQDKDKVNMILEGYDDLFHDLGILKDFKVKLHVEESVQPVAQSHQRVPFHVREKLEE